MTVGQVAKNVLRVIDRNSPIILTGLAVVGVVSTTVLAVKATPEALWLIEKERSRRIQANENDERYPDALTVTEVIGLTWRIYLPAAGVGALTIAAVIGAQGVNSRRQAALAGGLTLVERALTEYQEKVLELDPKVDQKVRDAIVVDRIASNPPTDKDLIQEDGTSLCYDVWSDRYFRSDMQTIRAAKNDVNEQIINGDMYANLNEFYTRIGLPAMPSGEDVGWSTEKLMDLNFTSTLTEGGTPCLAMSFRAKPLQDYYRSH